MALAVMARNGTEARGAVVELAHEDIRLDCLTALGYDLVQGYYFGRPETTRGDARSLAGTQASRDSLTPSKCLALRT